MSVSAGFHSIVRRVRRRVARVPGARRAWHRITWLVRRDSYLTADPFPPARIPGYELERHAALGRSARLGFAADSRAGAILAQRNFVLPRFVDHIDHIPPGSDVTFFTVCTDAYAPGLEALLLSLLKTYPSLESPFVVAHDGNLSPLNQDRIHGIYGNVEFWERSPERYAQVKLGDDGNHKRIGLLGYLNLDALELADPKYVVILDSDLIILGDISPLWTGDRPRAVLDAGVAPLAQVSAHSHRAVFNSGVISLPKSARGPAAMAHAAEILSSLATLEDESIERFADQKFWNVYLWALEAEVLPQNFNVNKTLIERFYPQELASTSTLHVTGTKPWFPLTGDRNDADATRAYRRAAADSPLTFALWNKVYESGIRESRTRRFLTEEGRRLELLRGSASHRAVALIGNGPSIAQTDLAAFADYEKVVFNWFPRFERFDELAPQHLVIASHMIFGSWHTARPRLPQEYLDMLASRSHRPRIWCSFYFKPYLESLPELSDYERSYFLFEKPLKRTIDRTGYPQLDILQPLTDANTGVLTAGVPMALLFGTDTVVLTGCDSNYSSSSGSYFYRASDHASKTTREGSLVETWERGGRGQYGYTVTKRELDRLGIRLLDATVGGALDLPKISLDDVRDIAQTAKK